ncbi:MAG TPA: flagellar protein FlbD [Firmicutes bacterium]|jgi:flagellar protein FlbD|nr:flagellar protein FlbD [Bacillota bacterium]
MIEVTRFNGEHFWLNPHIIEYMEETPDMVVTLLTGKKIVIREKADEVRQKILEYRRQLGEGGQEFAPIENRGEQ